MKRATAATFAARLVELDQRRQQRAQQQRRAGTVAVVALVAHLERLRGHRAQVDRLAQPLERAGEHAREHVADPGQAVEHLVVVGAVPQHLAEALVERAERAVAVRRVLDHAHRHRRADDARHRPDRAALVARPELELAVGGASRGVLAVARQTLVDGGADHGPAQRAGHVGPVDRRPGVQDRALAHPRQQVAGDADAGEQRLRVVEPLHRLVVRARDRRRLEREPRQRVRGARLGRAPFDALDGHALALELVGEQVDAGVRDRERAPEQVSHRRPPWRAGRRARCCA